MRKSTASTRRVGCLLYGLGVVFAHGLFAADHVAQSRTIAVNECVVYVATDTSKRVDCTSKAKSVCGGKAERCELPIGMTLTDGRDIDGNSRTWEKVIVRYQCNGTKQVTGPHDQNDHGVMVLACYY